MLQWVAVRTRKAFDFIPLRSISEAITMYDLQVQLCEWRKFRTAVDPKRQLLGEKPKSADSAAPPRPPQPRPPQKPPQHAAPAPPAQTPTIPRKPAKMPRPEQHAHAR
mmetsp:Transcript_1019/g.3745  ORF Transcript_1019/g.3745 Transcript_1019/m.3745 type:complete len:108 (-) Transcript_1019:190-513(-)